MQHFFNIFKSQNSENNKVQLEVFFKIRQLFVVVPKIETTFSQRTRFAIYKSIYIISGDQNVGSHNGSFPSKKTWIVDPTNEFQIKFIYFQKISNIFIVTFLVCFYLKSFNKSINLFTT